MLDTNPEKFSPNVILRPLYQEVILPNLCYIGGGGEIAYWLELKSNFESNKIIFPILLLRNSVLLTTDKQKIERLVSLSENLLKFQMGYTGKENFILTDSLTISENVEPIDVLKYDVSKRSEYQMLETQQRLNAINLKRMQFGYLPSLIAYGSMSYSGQRNQFDFFDRTKDWFPTALIGGTLSLNLFDGLQRHYKIQQIKIDYKKGDNNLKNLQLAIELETASAFVNYNNATSSLQIQKRNLNLAKNIYTVSQKKYEQGVGSNLEVINAQASLKESETNYFNAIYDMLVYKIDYQKATGTLVK